VRYLRRSPAAKRRHIHSKRLLLLAHLHRPSVFSCSTFSTLATCYLSRLEVARTTPCFPLLYEMILLPFVQPVTHVGSPENGRLCLPGRNRCQFIEQYRLGRNNIFACPRFARVHLVQSNEMLSRYSCSTMSKIPTFFSEICLLANCH